MNTRAWSTDGWDFVLAYAEVDALAEEFVDHRPTKNPQPLRVVAQGRDLVRFHDAGCVVERGGSLTSLEDLHDRPYREHVLLRDALREVKSTPVRRSISASSS